MEQGGATGGMGKGMMQGCCGGGMGKDMKGCCGGGMGKCMKQGGATGGMGKGMMQGCCGGGMGKGMKQGGATGGMGKGMKGGCKMNMSKVRHHFVMQNGINKRYVDKINTLQDSPGNVKAGKRLYEQNCASCHGLTGQGDGKAGKGLNPGPTNIAMFSKMPMASDGYLLWTVAEGGAPLQTAMPAFKNSLTADEIWKIVIYLRQL
jgi:mono/diheme cytochrome c family protein